MATGHMNPGYDNIVSQFKSALVNPTGERVKAQFNQNELNDIKARARSAWSIRDNSETTYGHFHRDPNYNDKTIYRPSSPSRRNNPHPHLVFLTTRLRNLPGYFNNNLDSNSFTNQDQYNQSLLNMSQNGKRMPSTVSVYANANEYLYSLHPEDVESTENSLRQAGIDPQRVSKFERPRTRSGNVINHYYTHRDPNNYEKEPASNYDAEEFEKSSNSIISNGNPKIKLQSNMTNPYLYDDLRIYREKYANKDHGLPNPNAKKPARGDFLIHYDWNPRLKHHKLPCLC